MTILAQIETILCFSTVAIWAKTVRFVRKIDTNFEFPGVVPANQFLSQLTHWAAHSATSVSDMAAFPASCCFIAIVLRLSVGKRAFPVYRYGRAWHMAPTPGVWCHVLHPKDEMPGVRADN